MSRLSSDLWAKEMMKATMRSPYSQWRERMRQEWLALPWYTRAWRRTKSRARSARRRLGEIIAGERFDD